MTIVNFTHCFYTSTICTVSHKADGEPCNGDISILRIVYLREVLLCVTGYAMGRICFCYRDSRLYTFSTLCIGSKFQRHVCERGMGVFCPSEPLSTTIPMASVLGPLEKCEWYWLYQFILRWESSKCSLVESSQLSSLKCKQDTNKEEKMLKLVSVLL